MLLKYFFLVIGLPVCIFLKAKCILAGYMLNIGLEKGCIHNINQDITYQCNLLSPKIVELISQGGLIGNVHQRLKKYINGINLCFVKTANYAKYQLKA